MARFGISGIIAKENNDTKVILKQSKGNTNCWCGNISFNFKKEAKQLTSGIVSVHEYVAELCREGTMSIVETAGFISNGNPVLLSSLYPDYEEYFTCFIKTGYGLYLLTLGSKTVQEFRAAGHDTFLKSRVPFVLTIQETDGRKQFVAVNLLPSLRPDEQYQNQTKGVKDEPQTGE